MRMGGSAGKAPRQFLRAWSPNNGEIRPPGKLYTADLSSYKDRCDATYPRFS